MDELRATRPVMAKGRSQPQPEPRMLWRRHSREAGEQRRPPTSKAGHHREAWLQAQSMRPFSFFVMISSGVMMITTPPQPARQSRSTAESRHWERVSKSSSLFMPGRQKDSQTPKSCSEEVPETTKSWAFDMAPMKSKAQRKGFLSLSRPATTGSVKYGPKRFSYSMEEMRFPTVCGCMVRSSRRLKSLMRKSSSWAIVCTSVARPASPTKVWSVSWKTFCRWQPSVCSCRTP
mmetsp:Transcript_150199/g.418491  ORF Transcript_150199/g.418491 Transcript_150199/m.418491 type:complete len:233 (+) Transcript_150199:60-758(+)